LAFEQILLRAVKIVVRLIQGRLLVANLSASRRRRLEAQLIGSGPLKRTALYPGRLRIGPFGLLIVFSDLPKEGMA
jgi:hypothetical protein